MGDVWPILEYGQSVKKFLGYIFQTSNELCNMFIKHVNINVVL